MKIENIFFDLDNTLWDFKKNSTNTLKEIAFKFKFKNLGINSTKKFISVYNVFNDQLWELYRLDKITKEKLRSERFRLALEYFNVKSNHISEKIGIYYINESPKKKDLVPHTKTVLKYLKEKYRLHIITNGFEEVQYKKLANCKISNFFSTVITSEQIGFKKPNAKIFEHSLSITNSKKNNSIMIGDDLEADIIGAEKYGIKSIYFNRYKSKHKNNPFKEINCLSEIFQIL